MATKEIFDTEGYEGGAYSVVVDAAQKEGSCIAYDSFIPLVRIVAKNPCFVEMVAIDDKVLDLSGMERVEYEGDYDFMCAKTEAERLCKYLGIPCEIVENWDERLNRADEWGGNAVEFAGWDECEKADSDWNDESKNPDWVDNHVGGTVAKRMAADYGWNDF